MSKEKKPKIDLKKAGDAEIFGALAVSGRRKRHLSESHLRFHPSIVQKRAIFLFLDGLFTVAEDAGAKDDNYLQIGELLLNVRHVKKTKTQDKNLQILSVLKKR